MRMTVTTARVLAVLLAEPGTDRYGLDLMRATGLASGSLYPILHRLQAAGWLTARWEEIDPAAEGRPARRFYRLTPEGVAQARQALAELRTQTAVPAAPGAARPAW
ncbi:PadR family transcriptional regulator [Couchioplanes azureus]|uniref:PadR family transcriptional regulator n=1 Tax=Couchioplanes caeruleus TaxID=56438 RepID=UPI00166FEE7D|nr:PadR family transcriptional regulator [Couchioplanes caeruleus]GGQ49379.1 PadR family transcriptional regulator [Couchioplanes caeruleus subsp. azureus]